MGDVHLPNWRIFFLPLSVYPEAYVRVRVPPTLANHHANRNHPAIILPQSLPVPEF